MTSSNKYTVTFGNFDSVFTAKSPESAASAWLRDAGYQDARAIVTPEGDRYVVSAKYGMVSTVIVTGHDGYQTIVKINPQ